MSRYLLYLRITWTVFCGIACVLVVLLWVRSYWWFGAWVGPRINDYYVGLGSSPGVFDLGLYDATDQFNFSRAWSSSWTDAEEWWSLMRVDENGHVLPHESPFWGFFTYDYGFIAVPFWFAGLLSIAIAVLPWFSGRFSLRTLLIATTLAAVLLGLVVWLR
jgi:hypothetical protein